MESSVNEMILTAAIGSSFSFVVALIVSFFSFKRNSTISINRDVDRKLRDKLDEKIFNAYRDSHEKKHREEKEVNKEFRNWLREEVSGIREDIRDLKK